MGESYSFTVGTAISLLDSSGNAVPNMDVFNEIYKLVEKKAAEYDQDVLEGLFVRVYLSRSIRKKEFPSDDQIGIVLLNWILAGYLLPLIPLSRSQTTGGCI
jgi:hypothetical protein